MKPMESTLKLSELEQKLADLILEEGGKSKKVDPDRKYEVSLSELRTVVEQQVEALMK